MSTVSQAVVFCLILQAILNKRSREVLSEPQMQSHTSISNTIVCADM